MAGTLSALMLSRYLASALLLLSSSVLAVPADPFNGPTTIGRKCGSTPSDEEVAAAEARFAEHKVTSNPDAAAKVISVHFHVVYKNTSCVLPRLNDGHEHGFLLRPLRYFLTFWLFLVETFRIPRLRTKSRC